MWELDRSGDSGDDEKECRHTYDMNLTRVADELDFS